MAEEITIITWSVVEQREVFDQILRYEIKATVIVEVASVWALPLGIVQDYCWE